MSLRPIAIYLPQYHPIPENDDWWGKGFTEWRNVTKAKPLFKDHYQPHLPADLGFYDLRVPEVREEQARLAKEHGIYGFCYYHYWFNGRRILERPFQEVFESGKPDFPFMLCWANENWTRTWDGMDKEILLQQNYSENDDRAHIRSLIPYLKDHRYIRVDRRPIIAIYRSNLLPNPKRTMEIWREEAGNEGIELYMCRFESFSHSGVQYLEDGNFDAAIDFQPFGHNMSEFQQAHFQAFENRSVIERAIAKFKRTIFKVYDKRKFDIEVTNKWRVWSYREYVRYVTHSEHPDYKCFPGITPGWDNSARRRKGYFILKDSTPELYKEWLQHITKNFKPYSAEENFLFMNAWNEWAEGNHLEPCLKWGLQYLQVTKDLIEMK